MSEVPVKELYRDRADGVRGDEGSGGFIRSAAGYHRKPTAPAVARLSPSAQDRVAPRRARKIVHLTFFAASCTIGI